MRCNRNLKICGNGFGTRQWAETRKILKGSVGESPKDLEETNKGSLITLDEAIREGFKEGEEKITRSWNVMEILVM